MHKKSMYKAIVAVAIALALLVPGAIAFANEDGQTVGSLSVSEGSILAWGLNNYFQCDVPAPNSDFTDVDGGKSHSLGLKSNGSIAAWGSNNQGQCDVPAPNGDFTAVSAGNGHDLGLKSNGSIVAWGMNSYGQCDVPAPNSDFTAVAAGGGGLHSLGLKSNGSIVGWGKNHLGQCDAPLPNSDFTAVVAGSYHSLGLKSNGSIVAWGSNYYGGCDVPAPNSDFTAVAAGEYHSLGLKSNGSIVGWGLNDHGRCDVPAPNSDFIAVAAGEGHTLGLKSDGSIVAWGLNNFGQCDVPLPNSAFTAVSSGSCGRHSLGLKGPSATYTLDISVDGSGTTDPAVGVYSYESGTVVTLTAIPDSGWVFDRWSGDLAGSTNPDNITMDGNKEVTAHFEMIVVTSLSYKWNMISVPFNYSVNKADFYVKYGGTYYTWADAVSGGIVANALFGWNGITQGYEQPSGDILEPDCGYWMWAYYDCTLNVLA